MGIEIVNLVNAVLSAGLLFLIGFGLTRVLQYITTAKK